MKYLVVLVNLIFWVSTMSSYVFTVFCLKHAVDMLYGITVLCADSVPRNYFRRSYREGVVSYELLEVVLRRDTED